MPTFFVVRRFEITEFVEAEYADAAIEKVESSDRPHNIDDFDYIDASAYYVGDYHPEREDTQKDGAE